MSRRMRIYQLILLTLLLIGCAACSRSLSSLKPSDLDEKPIPFSPTPPTEWKLPNGVSVMFIEDHELPLVQGAIYMRGGGLWEPENLKGLAGAMGGQMRQGGAGERSADELDRELELLSAGISSSFGAEFGSVSFGGLSTDLDQIFSMFADVLLRPRFQMDRINLWKGQALESIRRRADDPSTIAGISFEQLVYPGSRYGKVTVEDDVRKITRDDIVALHNYFVRPDEALLVVTGDLHREDLQALIDRYLAAWEPRGSPLPAVPDLGPPPTPGIYFVKKPFTQSTIVMGQLGVPRLSPDQIPIQVFNDLFGSMEFHSRLMRKVRTEMGLAYWIYGRIGDGPVRGKNVISVQTKAESTADVVLAALRELERMQTDLVDDQELEQTERSLQNSFVFNFDSPEAIASRRANLKMLNYPDDYDATYLKKLAAVSRDAVKQVADDRWKLGEFVIVVVGNESAYTALEKALQDPPEELKNMTLHLATFNAKLQLGQIEADGKTVSTEPESRGF